MMLHKGHEKRPRRPFPPPLTASPKAADRCSTAPGNGPAATGALLGPDESRRRAGLDDDEGLGERRLVGDGQVNDGLGPGRQDRPEASRRAAAQAHRRLAGGEIDHAHVAPIDAAPEAGAERLGAGLLGRKPLGVGGRARRAPVRLPPLGLGEAAADEALAVSRERLFDAADVAKVAADAKDHCRPSATARPASIAARMHFTLSARPTKIASPIRKWPMLSSTICGRAAITRAES